MIKVIIADDHHLVRQGIRALIEKADDIAVIGEAQDGQEAVSLVERLAPDVAVLDIGMPRLNGTQATLQIQALAVPTQVVILSMHSDKMLVRQALENGAKGYLLKDSVKEELLLAIQAASRNETYLSPAISKNSVTDFLMAPLAENETGFDQLTTREREVLQLVAEGHTTREIAGLLNVSIKTVEAHRSNLMHKLSTHDIAGLTRLAIKHGLVFIDNINQK